MKRTRSFAAEVVEELVQLAERYRGMPKSIAALREAIGVVRRVERRRAKRLNPRKPQRGKEKRK